LTLSLPPLVKASGPARTEGPGWQGSFHPGGQALSDIGKTIGHRIRELRTQRSERWTQEDLAERARISVSFLSMIERGERVAHVETLASLADALGVTLAELFVAPAEKPADQQEILRPLSEFVRSRHLDSRDVEKLLGVARAMFASSNGVA
jgi:transcriptional regulator with XRE-family HTH domain